MEAIFIMLVAVIGIYTYAQVQIAKDKALDAQRNTQVMVDAINDLANTLRGE